MDIEYIDSGSTVYKDSYNSDKSSDSTKRQFCEKSGLNNECMFYCTTINKLDNVDPKNPFKRHWCDKYVTNFCQELAKDDKTKDDPGWNKICDFANYKNYEPGDGSNPDWDLRNYCLQSHEDSDNDTTANCLKYCNTKLGQHSDHWCEVYASRVCGKYTSPNGEKHQKDIENKTVHDLCQNSQQQYATRYRLTGDNICIPEQPGDDQHSDTLFFWTNSCGKLGWRMNDDEKKLCCLNENISYGNVKCPELWRSTNSDNKVCDTNTDLKQYCDIATNYDRACDHFCSTNEPGNTISRKQKTDHWCHSAIANFCNETKPELPTRMSSLCTSNRYDCDENGECKPTIGGVYLEDPTCGGGKCPSTKYYCNEGGQCSLVVDGISPNKTYSSANCNGECKILRYACFEDGCKENPLGRYTTPTCDSKCDRYACINKKCVKAEGGSFKTENDCLDQGCGGAPLPTYDCVKNQCVLNKEGKGKYKNKSCEGDCQPSITRYDCVDNDCKEKEGGPYTDSSCEGKCSSPLETMYDCDKSGKCVSTKNGRFYTNQCGGTCVPSESTKTYLYLAAGGLGLFVILILISFFVNRKRKNK